MQNVGNEILVSICTSTYNRAHTLSLPYNSISNQTYKNIEWVIVDGGSTDSTPQLIEKWKKEAPFPIRYVQLEKSGKHIALNHLFQLANGKYFVELDSDDELLSDAVERALAIWQSLSNPSEYSAIVGHCLDGKTRKLVGSLFPENINSYPLKKQTKLRMATRGEKISIRKTEILRNYAFPEIPNIRYISEGYVWDRIDLKYKQYCTNEIFRIYYPSPDALTVLYSQKFDDSYLLTQYWNEKLAIKDVFGTTKSPWSIIYLRSIWVYWCTVFQLKYKLFGDFGFFRPIQKYMLLVSLLPSYLGYKIFVVSNGGQRLLKKLLEWYRRIKYGADE